MSPALRQPTVTAERTEPPRPAIRIGQECPPAPFAASLHGPELSDSPHDEWLARSDQSGVLPPRIAAVTGWHEVRGAIIPALVVEVVCFQCSVLPGHNLSAPVAVVAPRSSLIEEDQPVFEHPTEPISQWMTGAADQPVPAGAARLRRGMPPSPENAARLRAEPATFPLHLTGRRVPHELRPAVSTASSQSRAASRPFGATAMGTELGCPASHPVSLRQERRLARPADDLDQWQHGQDRTISFCRYARVR